MQFRVVTLNLEQDHKRWAGRQSMISAETAALRPDVIAFNEVSVPLQTARTLRDSATAMIGVPYNLVQQTRVNGLSKVEGEALLTRFPVVETGNLDYQTRDIVALVARVPIGEATVDIYVTHLYMSRGDDSLRLFQVQPSWRAARTRPATSSNAVSLGSRNSSRPSGPSCVTTVRRHARPRTRPASAGAAVGRYRRSTACRSASRTSLRPPTCRLSRARHYLSAAAPAAMRPASRHCARPAQSSSARR